MADSGERTDNEEALLCLDVSFNEFDDELSDSDKYGSNNNVNANSTSDHIHEIKGHQKIANSVLSSCGVDEFEPCVKTENTCSTDSAKTEDGEILGSSEDEQMDYDEDDNVENGHTLASLTSSKTNVRESETIDSTSLFEGSVDEQSETIDTTSLFQGAIEKESETINTTSVFKGLVDKESETTLSLFQSSVDGESLQKQTLKEGGASVTDKISDESGMDSDNSQDDQSWKRTKRPRLEGGSFHQGPGDGDRTTEKVEGEARKKTRGGRKKRKKPSYRHHDREPLRHRRDRNERGSEMGKLFEPPRVTAQDSEEEVAKEIAEKLDEVRKKERKTVETRRRQIQTLQKLEFRLLMSPLVRYFVQIRTAKTLLINRVVSCIGCEKALKLFKETQEVQRHGGMWTQDNHRRRTSGGVFLTLLKFRYATKEQIKWIFAVENELAKQKAKDQQQRMKELRMKNVMDLRSKLKERDDEK